MTDPAVGDNGQKWALRPHALRRATWGQALRRGRKAHGVTAVGAGGRVRGRL